MSLMTIGARRIGAPALALLFSLGGLAACGGGDDDAFCDQLRDLVENDLGDDVDPSDPSSIDAVVDRLDAVAADAPAEVADDAAKVRDTFRALAEAVADGDSEALLELDMEGMAAAAQALEEYANTTC